jgi:biofilm PGA synthesis N-glycosyltransferase PgaC
MDFNIIDKVVNFFLDHSLREIIITFWPFFLFDFPRYVLLDIICIPIFTAIRWFDKYKIKKAKLDLYKEYPLVSVIAPGKNEGEHISSLVESLKKQTYKNLEIIIIDDGSDDKTPEILRKLKKQGLIDIFFRNERRGGKASAENLALRYSKGKFIIHLDADTHLKSDAIENIILPFYVNTNVGEVSGEVRIKNINYNILTKLQALEYLKTISTGRIVNSILKILRIVSGAFGAFRKDILTRIKGWDVGPGMDGDITLRIRKLGYQAVHEPSAICYTSVPISITKLTRQRYRWSRSLVRFRLRKHKDLLSFKNKNFNIFNTLTVYDNIFFNFILDFKWFVYLFQIIFLFQLNIITINAINYILYFMLNIVEYLLALIFLGKTFRKEEKFLWLYLPLMPIYTGIFLRLIRTFAYIMEIFFKISFYDKWNPWKVSRIVKDEN